MADDFLIVQAVIDMLTLQDGNTLKDYFNCQRNRVCLQQEADEKDINVKTIYQKVWRVKSKIRMNAINTHDEDARLWYLDVASLEDWSVRTLDRNIGTQYYYRLLKSPARNKVIAEMKEKTAPFDRQPSELIKSPVVDDVRVRRK